MLEPAEFRIARIVGEQRSRAREHIFRRVAASVPNGLAGTVPPGAKDVGDSLARACRVTPSRGVGCFLWQSYRDAVDQTVDMFDKLLTRAHTQAQNELDEQLCSQRRTIQASLTALRSLGRIILDDAISDEELCALLLKLRDELKAGNLSVRYSKRFARLEEFFIDDLRWQGIREDFFRRSGLPSDTKRVPEYLTLRLAEAYERFLKMPPSNSYAVVDKDGWRLSTDPTEKLDQEEQDRLARLKSWLAKQMRRVKLPDLPSSGITSCSTVSTSWIESSSAGAEAQKGPSLAYRTTRISLVP